MSANPIWHPLLRFVMHNELMDSEVGSPSNSNATSTGTPAVDAPARPAVDRARRALVALTVVLGLALAFLWQKVEHMQAELARASTDSTQSALEAKVSARNAQDSVRELSTRLGVAESRLGEVSLQRSQLEELMQSLTRSRDENLISDIDAAVRLAQQQAQMLGSTEPLLASLRTVEQRLKRNAQPRLASVSRAVTRDMDRLKTTRVLDIGNASVSLDEISRLVDEMPLAQDVHAPKAASTTMAPSTTVDAVLDWGERFVNELRALVRVSRIDTPDSALLSPSQSYFARENLKLRLLNARLGLMSRQLASASADLKTVQSSLARYFDPNSKAVQIAKERLSQVQAQLQSAELPRIDETLSALAAAAGVAGK
jgi:uroporphyrin-III C-methyltransferase